MINKILVCGTILSNVLLAKILMLTIYHHFTVKKELDALKNQNPSS
ncbi:hypothetical protein [Salinicoccus halitifaciens]|uniref:Uncharacterized protein n=1 Tax=Salinicoccus halitifaciens TaxID=1073415 RepID=A0ABV2EA38_9STAP|nr:hypothetical protein [Salinicoccus halitifaciens]MCD2138406.1 hypothetical protein [Salinicoccus halitifaciens]